MSLSFRLLPFFTLSFKLSATISKTLSPNLCMSAFECQKQLLPCATLHFMTDCVALGLGSASLSRGIATALLVPLLLLFAHSRPDHPLEELPVAHQRHTVTAASLVPASEPEEGHDFLSAQAAFGKLVLFSGVCLHAHCHGALFFSLHRLLHVP